MSGRFAEKIKAHRRLSAVKQNDRVNTLFDAISAAQESTWRDIQQLSSSAPGESTSDGSRKV